MAVVPYCQTLDFKVFQKGLEMVTANNKGKDPLKDVDGISPETLKFFEDLLNARSTSQLSKYSDEVMNEGMELIYGSEKIMSYISNYLDDETILRDRDTLVKAIQQRHLKSSRRLL